MDCASHASSNGTLGPVSRKSRKLSGSEKPFVKLRPTYSLKLVFSYVVKGIKIKITAKFRASRRFRFEETKEIMSPEIFPKSRTFEKRAPRLYVSMPEFYLDDSFHENKDCMQEAGHSLKCIRHENLYFDFCGYTCVINSLSVENSLKNFFLYLPNKVPFEPEIGMFWTSLISTIFHILSERKTRNFMLSEAI